MMQCHHYYIGNGIRVLAAPVIQVTLDDSDYGIQPKILWTTEKICILCNKIAVFNQDGDEVSE